jgi:hypothetical protein
MYILSDDILYYILDLCEYPEVISLRHTCRRFKILTDDIRFWKYRLIRSLLVPYDVILDITMYYNIKYKVTSELTTLILVNLQVYSQYGVTYGSEKFKSPRLLLTRALISNNWRMVRYLIDNIVNYEDILYSMVELSMDPKLPPDKIFTILLFLDIRYHIPSKFWLYVLDYTNSYKLLSLLYSWLSHRHPSISIIWLNNRGKYLVLNIPPPSVYDILGCNLVSLYSINHNNRDILTSIKNKGHIDIYRWLKRRKNMLIKYK